MYIEMYIYIYIYVVGDSPMTKIYPKGILIKTKLVAVISTLPVYVEPRKPSSETWIHLCSTSYLRIELFIYWPFIIGHNSIYIYIYIYIYTYWLLVGRVFANGPVNLGRLIPKT